MHIFLEENPNQHCFLSDWCANKGFNAFTIIHCQDVKHKTVTVAMNQKHGLPLCSVICISGLFDFLVVIPQ